MSNIINKLKLAYGEINKTNIASLLKIMFDFFLGSISNLEFEVITNKR